MLLKRKKEYKNDKRIVLITGGAGGIGKATVNKFFGKKLYSYNN